ncbi:unnamed protein product, partial [Mesorhabditis spiculigera]
MLYLFSTFIAFVVTVTSAGNCPPGAVDYSEGQECLLGINAPAEYAAAAQTCTMLGGRLVQPRNSLENVLAGSQSIEALHGQAAFLGVRRINGVWRYADGTALAYQNWKNGTGLAGQDCATFRGNDLSWYPDLCTGVRPFICSFSDQLTNGTHGCPSGWKYYRFTQSCYYAPPWNFAAPVSLTLNDGAARCRSVGADLASIHSEKENRFINEMVWSVRENWDVTCSQTQGARYLIAIIGSCPPGAVEYNEGEECLLGINAPTNYWGAASTCEMLGGRLVQPTSALENILAGSQGIQTLNGQSAYIGVARNNGVWRYSDGTPLVYQNWKNGTGHPGEDCAAFGASDLSWYPGTCATFHPFICSFSNQLTNGCPAGWKYYRFTDSCYHASAWNFADPALLPLSVGVTRCRNVGADLVSIHSERENHFVHVLAWTVRENWNVTRCTAASSNMFVIGLAFNGRDTEVPEWTDGAAYDYTAVDRAGLASYGVYNDPICSSTRSWYGAAAGKFGGYICKKKAIVAGAGPSLEEKLARIEKLATRARLNNIPFVPPNSL